MNGRCRVTRKALMDSRWIEEAIDRYEKPLMRYTLGLIGNVDQAREIVQETYFRLCGQSQEKVESYLAPWLFKVCRNQVIDRKRREMKVLELTTASEPDLSDRSLSPAAALERKETLGRIEQLLSDLSTNQQEVVRLKFQAELSYKEISEVTGLSVSNVGFLLHTAIKQLRQRLSEDVPKKGLRRIK
jgi:RNA polymerase sigma-70 factor (ECF subfamily)